MLKEGPRRYPLAVLGMWLCCSVLFGHPSRSAAQDSGINLDAFPTREEFEALPRFCVVQRRHSPAAGESLGGLTPGLVEEGKRWQALLGAGVWSGLHHYCAGLNRLNRYKKSVRLNSEPQKALTRGQHLTLVGALEEFRYMQGYMEAERSVLYPDWALNQAIAHRLLGESEKAKERLLAAIVFKDDYDLPYLELASLLDEERNRSEAISVLKLGLTRTRGSAAIRAMLDSMQGD